MENVRIRKIRPDDAADISRIQTAITQSPAAVDFRSILEDQVRKGEDASLVAEINGKVVGYMISYTVFGGFGLERGAAWIATLGVYPKYMVQGISKRLANEILAICEGKGITDIYTSVRWDSVDLLSFFKALGFDRSDFINLRKDLRA